jgi:tetratricopeptide (TPR) repeat protein
VNRLFSRPAGKILQSAPVRSLRIVPILVLTLCSAHLHPAASRQLGDAAFGEILSAYQAGRSAEAVAAFARWSPEKVESDATLSSGKPMPPWVRASVALLHLEAGLANDTFGTDAANSRVLVGTLADVEVHARRSTTIVNELAREAVRTGDQRLLAFCRLWHITASTSARLFQAPIADDPVFVLLEGRSHEFWMGPEICCGGLIEFNLLTDTDLVTRSHGKFSAQEARSAQASFRKALKLDPLLAEANLRLGHVLYLMDDRSGAEAQWQVAVRSAANRQDTFTSYLAHLFLARLYEDLGRNGAAKESYRRALTSLHEGQAATAGLARLLIETGEPEAGWSLLEHQVGSPRATAAVVDPWYSYSPIQGAWARDERLRQLRELVTQ